MVEQRPVQTSAVYLLGGAQFPADPPPSPPSPATPGSTEICAPISALDLDRTPAPTSIPPTPGPEPGPNTDADHRLTSATHVLTTEATALHSLAHLYSTSAAARGAFHIAVDAILRSAATNGKLVLSGVGKSGLIARKLVGTFNSLSVPSVFLHPTESLHGDLGLLTPSDTMLLITFSGSTPELLALLPHIDRSLPVILLTAHTRVEGCALGALRPDAVLLPAPVHENEQISFGVAAPMTSTTAAMAVGDALALVVARERWRIGGGGGRPGSGMEVAAVFRRNHPGGAIGAAAGMLAPGPLPPAVRVGAVRDVAVPWSAVAVLEPCVGQLDGQGVTGADVLRAAYVSTSGWVRTADGIVFAPSRIRRLSSADLAKSVEDMPWLGAPRDELVALAAETTARRAREWINGIQGRREDDDEQVGRDQILVAVLEKGEICGVLEARQLFGEPEDGMPV